MEPHPLGYGFHLLFMLYQLGMGAFRIICIYALFTTRTESVSAACGGDSLWIFVLCRVVLPFVLALLGAPFYLCRRRLIPTDKTLYLFYWIPLILSSAFLTGFVVLGFVLTSDAMGRPACQAELVAAGRFLDSPLLANAGWVYVALDALGVSFCLGCMVLLLYMQLLR